MNWHQYPGLLGLLLAACASRAPASITGQGCVEATEVFAVPLGLRSPPDSTSALVMRSVARETPSTISSLGAAQRFGALSPLRRRALRSLGLDMDLGLKAGGVPRPHEVSKNWESLQVPELEIWIPLDLNTMGFQGVATDDYLWVKAQDWPASFRDTESFWNNDFAGNAATTPSAGNFGIASLLAQRRWTLGSPFVGTAPTVYVHDIQHLATFWIDGQYLQSLHKESRRLVARVLKDSPQAATFGRDLENRYNWALEQLVVFRPAHRGTPPPMILSAAPEVRRAWSHPDLVTSGDLQKIFGSWSEDQLRSFGGRLHRELGHWIEPLGGAVADDLSFRFESSILDSRVYSSRLDYFSDVWGNLSLAVAEGNSAELTRHISNMLAYLIELKRWNAQQLVESALRNPNDKTQAFERLLRDTQVAARAWNLYGFDPPNTP